MGTRVSAIATLPPANTRCLIEIKDAGFASPQSRAARLVTVPMAP